MALYTNDSKDRVRDAVDFVELVSARTDLRRAEHLMDWAEFRNVKHDLDDAKHHVREAIGEIDHAAAWDHKDLIDNPPIDTYPDRAGRFHAIARFLSGAKRDIEREEDNPAARGWRDRAIHHLAQAIAASIAPPATNGATNGSASSEHPSPS